MTSAQLAPTLATNPWDLSVEALASFPGRTATERPMQATAVSTAEELAALAPEWIALQELSGPYSVFQSFAQIDIWQRHFTADAKGPNRLFVVVVRQGGRAIMILPLVICRVGFTRIARLAGDPIAQYADVLIDPTADQQTAFDAALDHIAAAQIDVIVLRRVREDAHLLALGAERLQRTGCATGAPYACFKAYPNFESFKKSLSRKTRQNLRNRRNHLAKSGDFAFEILAGGPEARQAAADAFELKRNWMINNGALSSAFLDAKTRECLLDLAEDRNGAGTIVLRLNINGQPAATRIGFEYQGTHFTYISAYDESFAHVSPGKLLMEFGITHFKERGLHRLDMLAPSSRDKAEWCRFETKVADYALPLTKAGRVYASIYLQRLRPALLCGWKRLPDRVRSVATALFVTI